MLGADWLNKLGIVILVLGVAFFLAYQLGELGPAGKALVGFLVGAGILGGSLYLERRERYRIFARAGIGGGWAILFFTTYALYHVPAMQVLESQGADLVLMLLVAAGMVGHSLRYQSQVVTGLAFVLAFSTVTISRVSVYSLSASAVLALALVVIIVRLRWYELEVFGLLATYLNHWFWLYHFVSPMGEQRVMFPEFWPSATILFLYWAAFRTSYLLRQKVSDEEENVSTLAAILNTSLLLALLKYQSVDPQLAFWVLLGMGAVEFTLGQTRLARRRRPAFVALSTIGATLLLAAFPFRYSGQQLSVLWLAEAEAFFLAGVFLREVLFRRFGLVAAVLMALQLLLTPGALAASGLRHATVFAVAALVFYADAHWIPRRWTNLSENEYDRLGFQLLSYLGGVMALAGGWVGFQPDWSPVVWASLALGLAILARRLDAVELSAQAPIFAAAAFLRVWGANLELESKWHGVTLRLVTVSLVAALLYGAARWSGLATWEAAPRLRAAHSWAGTFLVMLLAWYELPDAWTAVAWMALALGLAILGRHLELTELTWQANALAAASFVRALLVNLGPIESYRPFTVSSLTVGLVAAAFYLLARWSGLVKWEAAPKLRAAHRWAGSILITTLLWYELPQAWVAVGWMVFALTLALVGRRLRLGELTTQANVLTGISFLVTVFHNLTIDELYHSFSLRLLTVSSVAALLYWFASWSDIEDREYTWVLPDVHRWLGSTLVALLLWYELLPASVALGWALLGLLLFELGLTTRSLQWRLQGYVTLAASFLRIFYVNLNADALPGEWSPRLLTVAPLALAYYYVYGRLADSRETFLADDRRMQAANLHCYLGSVGLAALLRFEVDLDWVIAAWAALALLLVTVAWRTGRQVFLGQGFLFSVAVAFRTLFHNFYARSQLPADPAHGPLLTVGATCALLFLCVPFARWHGDGGRAAVLPTGPTGQFTAAGLSRTSVKTFFFIPVILLTVLLAREMRSGMVTLTWGVEAVAVFLFALWAGERSFRLSGLGLLLLCVGKIVLIDVWELNPRDRYLTFIVLGSAMLLVSFFYTRYREIFRRYL